MQLKHYKSKLLTSDIAEHAFFTRDGGVSRGVFNSLNIITKYGDTEANTQANRSIITNFFNLPKNSLKLVYQVHLNNVLIVDNNNINDDLINFKADGLVTKKSKVILGIKTADCCPILFIDPQNKVIGAAHAGWNGAFSGIIQATILAMESIGADRKLIKGALGPAISWQSYEVDEVFKKRFINQSIENQRFFMSSNKLGHYLFNLKGYVGSIIDREAIKEFEDLNLNTYEDENQFFSCRRAFHKNEKGFGVQLSAIFLK